LSGSFGKNYDLGFIKVKGKYRFRIDGKFGNVPYSFGFRVLFCQSKSEIFRSRKNCRRPIKDYAERKNIDIEFAKKWLAPNLAD
jgi:5-methyltetrahydrofolate--homocysteine methyltransferase